MGPKSRQELQGRASGEGRPPDVLVVGAGPTGLLAAGLLARSGIPVRIIDKSPSQAKESRAFAVHARTLELLQTIGLAESLVERGVLATGARIYVDGERAAAIDLDIPRPDTPYPIILFVPQSEVEALLNEDLARLGLAVERGVTATALSQDPDGVTVEATGPSGENLRIETSYVIGADGAHSLVRKALGLTFEGEAYPRTFMLADCTVEGPLDPGPAALFFHGSDVALYFPLHGGNRGRVIALGSEPGPASAPAPLATQGSSPVTLEEVEASFRRAAGDRFRLRDAVWTSRYRVHHRGVNRYGVGRVFVAGDAAHIHSPAGGQGMNTGLQDVANLAWKIALAIKAGAPPALLESYDGERRPIGEKVLAFTDRGFSVATARSGWVAAFRNLVVPYFGAVVTRIDALRERLFHFVSQLGIRYHAGPAVQDDAGLGWSAGPQAGRRAPNAAIAYKTDVFDLLAGYRFHLLALSRTALGEPEMREAAARLEELRTCVGLDLGIRFVAHSTFGRGEGFVQAETAAVFAAYGIDHAIPQGLYLIRPDGYVAWRSRGFDVEGCQAFIAERFVAGR